MYVVWHNYPFRYFDIGKMFFDLNQTMLAFFTYIRINHFFILNFSKEIIMVKGANGDKIISGSRVIPILKTI